MSQLGTSHFPGPPVSALSDKTNAHNVLIGMLFLSRLLHEVTSLPQNLLDQTRLVRGSSGRICFAAGGVATLPGAFVSTASPGVINSAAVNIAAAWIVSLDFMFFGVFTA
jgi:hypothetical protein